MTTDDQRLMLEHYRRQIDTITRAQPRNAAEAAALALALAHYARCLHEMETAVKETAK